MVQGGGSRAGAEGVGGMGGVGVKPQAVGLV